MVKNPRGGEKFGMRTGGWGKKKCFLAPVGKQDQQLPPPMIGGKGKKKKRKTELRVEGAREKCDRKNRRDKRVKKKPL